MTSLFLVVILLVVSRFAWGTWKNTQRDIVRDKLFDLRDEWRTFFIENGFSMSCPEYTRVRAMINDYLRYTARFRLVGLLFVACCVPRKICLEMAERTKRELDSNNLRIAEEIAVIRGRAVSAIQKYMLYTSLLLFPFIVVVFCFGMVFGTGELLQRGQKVVKRIVIGSRPLSPDAIEMAVAT